MTISEKSAYLKGLAEGMKLDTDKPEGKLINGLLELVAEMSSTIETLDSQYAELSDYVDELDSDLGDVEEVLYDECDCDDDDDDDDYEYGEYEDCDGNCEGCDGCEEEEEDDDDDDGKDDVFDVEAEGMRCLMCDNCGDTICYDESLDPSEIVCPACGKKAVKAED